MGHSATHDTVHGMVHGHGYSTHLAQVVEIERLGTARIHVLAVVLLRKLGDQHRLVMSL